MGFLNSVCSDRARYQVRPVPRLRPTKSKAELPTDLPEARTKGPLSGPGGGEGCLAAARGSAPILVLDRYPGERIGGDALQRGVPLQASLDLADEQAGGRFGVAAVEGVRIPVGRLEMGAGSDEIGPFWLRKHGAPGAEEKIEITAADRAEAPQASRNAGATELVRGNDVALIASQCVVGRGHTQAGRLVQLSIAKTERQRLCARGRRRRASACLRCQPSQPESELLTSSPSPGTAPENG